MTSSFALSPFQRRQIAFLGGSFAIGVFSAFNNFTMSLWLHSFISSLLLISLLGNSRSFEGAIVSPLTGAWSDRVWLGWLGRRRPFILVGGLLAAVLLAVTPFIAQMTPGEDLGMSPATLLRLAPLIGAIFLFTLTFNAMDDIHKALMVDITTPAQRNRLSGWSVLVNMGGNVAILVLGFLLWSDGVPGWAFAFTGVLIAAGVMLTVLGVSEPSPARWKADQAAAPTTSGVRTSPLALLRKYRGAAVFLLVVFLFWAGVNAVLPLISIYTKEILGATTGEAQLLPALLLGSTTLLALRMARLGDRIGKREVLASGYAIMAIAAVGGLVVNTVPQGAVVFILAGVGNAASMVLAVPLMAELVPRHRMGLATGLLAASGSVAAPLSSVVAGTLSDVLGPRVIFAVMFVMVVVALPLIPFIRPPAPDTRIKSPVAETALPVGPESE